MFLFQMCEDSGSWLKKIEEKLKVMLLKILMQGLQVPSVSAFLARRGSVWTLIMSILVTWKCFTTRTLLLLPSRMCRALAP